MDTRHSYLPVFLLCCVARLLSEAATIPSEDTDTELLPSLQLTSAEEPLAIIPPLKALKLSKKERCRHIVKREVQKYAAKVQRLTNRVLSLQEEITLLRQQQVQQGLQFSEIRGNLSEQRQLLNKALKSVQQNMSSQQQQQGGISNDSSIVDGNQPTFTGIARDCDEIYRAGGMRFAGTYQMTIQPRANHSSFNVLCEPLNNAGWVVIQNRYDGEENFNRKWHEYKKGFGKLQADFWLGNELIHRITSAGPTTLRVELEEFSGRKHWAEYSSFSIENEMSNYKLHVDGFSGNAGDSLRHLNGMEFSTPDADHDSGLYDNCAELYSSGWWYGRDCKSNLNGAYIDRSKHEGFYVYEGVVWPYIHSHRSLKSARMLLKPTP